ncbi:MAG: hypothetical protein Q8R88_05160 [Desulfoprunum sp.]|nr:hypothetical protein [Desulfoprunum sp.]
MKISFNFISLVLLCGLVFSQVSCSVKKGGGADSSAKNMQPLASIVVLPAETVSDKGGESGNGGGDALRKGAGLVDITMNQETTDFRNVRVLNSRQIEDLMKEDSEFAATDVIKHLGSVLHCDAVLMITVNRYRQRVGGELAAESPASASFQMRLVDVKTKAVLWSTDFDETQESLLSNILTFNKAQSRGFKWISVESLVTRGIHDRLANCPYLTK